MHRTSRQTAVLTHAATFLLLATTASAADKAPLSSLPKLILPRDATDEGGKKGAAGLAVKATPSGAEVVAAAARGYCLSSTASGLRLQKSSSDLDGEMWHLAEKDGKATLERTRFGVLLSDMSVWVKSRSEITLHEVAQSKEVTVWGFREANGVVVLLAHGADGGRESPLPLKKDEFDFFRSASSDCSFGATRLNGAPSSPSAVARLEGSLPPVGSGAAMVITRWVADASVSRLAREAEPMLAVRVRFLDP